MFRCAAIRTEIALARGGVALCLEASGAAILASRGMTSGRA